MFSSPHWHHTCCGEINFLQRSQASSRARLLRWMRSIASKLPLVVHNVMNIDTEVCALGICVVFSITTVSKLNNAET